MELIVSLRARQLEIENRLAEFVKQVEAGTALDDKQQEEIGSLKVEFDRNSSQIRSIEIAMDVAKTAAAPVYKVSPASEGKAPAFVKGAREFKGMGDVAMAIYRQRTNQASTSDVQKLADMHGRKMQDWRNKNAVDSGLTVGTDSQGGFAVPGEYDTNVDRLVINDNSLLPLCRERVMSQDVATVPTNDVYPWAVFTGSGNTGGPQTITEGSAYPSSSIVLSTATLSLTKVGFIVPFTLEASRFGVIQAADLTDGAQLAMTYKVNAAIMASLTGAAGAVVTTGTKTPSGSFIYEDSVGMYNRLPPEWIGPSTRWVINPDLREKFQMFAVSGSQGIVLVNNPGDARQVPYGSVLHGIPVQPFFGMQRPGTQGDVALIDFSKVWVGTAGPVLLDYDPYAQFANGKGGFRWSYFIGVTPRLTAVATPPNGQTLSAYVVRASRTA